MKVFLIFSMFFLFSSVHSQQAFLTSGGDSVGGSDGSFSYSAGQVFYNTYEGSGGRIIQGMQFLISETILSTFPFPESSIEAIIYPNPSDVSVVLILKNLPSATFSFSMCDLQGRSLVSGRLTNQRTKIPLTDFSTGSYVLKVKQNDRLIKTFQLLKK